MSYGTNAPGGIMPSASILGGAWVEKFSKYYIYTDGTGMGTYATSLFTGDPIQWNTVAAQAGTIAQYNPGFADGTPSTFSTVPVLGSFQQLLYTDATGKSQVTGAWIAGTNTYPNTRITALVADDPNIIFDIQVSTNINANANAFVAAPLFPNTNTINANKGYFGSNFAFGIGGGNNFNTVPNPSNNNAGYNNNPATGDPIANKSAYYLNVSTSTDVAPNGNNHDYNKTVATLPLKAISYSLNTLNVPQQSPFSIGGNYTLETTPFVNVMVTLNNTVYGRTTSGTAFA